MKTWTILLCLHVFALAKIAFTANGERYEWSSETSILPNGGTWNLWVLHDPNYTPLFGSEKKPEHV